HKMSGRKLKRTASHRKAMLANMAVSLLKYERIETTVTKAKELRRYVEPIINRAKENTLHNKREIMRKIKDRKVIVKLFDNIALRYANRPGGYTRIIRLAKLRVGDNSKMALIELVEEALAAPQTPVEEKKTSADKKKKSSDAEQAGKSGAKSKKKASEKELKADDSAEASVEAKDSAEPPAEGDSK
ncbi:MAG: 50S ribosomal protein L17, partial [Spirochaetota bacterium]|nr:50S ribosomal protein L17 [Spirochaetota bacterium]